MKRFDIINSLLKKRNGTSYLEIGVQGKHKCYDKVMAKTKVGVDPDPKAGADFVLTSDEFFAHLDPKTRFDVIFIDGLHEDAQFQRDVLNALRFISLNGFIVMHDCNPQLEIEQVVPRISKRWNGDCWKAFVRLRFSLPYKTFTVDTDEGCGVMYYGDSDVTPNIQLDELTYQNLVKNRKDWLGLISVEEFQKWL